jgi:hypothetical protein
LWVPEYQKTHPDALITIQSTGSGAGITGAICGIAQIGARGSSAGDHIFRFPAVACLTFWCDAHYRPVMLMKVFAMTANESMAFFGSNEGDEYEQEV